MTCVYLWEWRELPGLTWVYFESAVVESSFMVIEDQARVKAGTFNF